MRFLLLLIVLIYLNLLTYFSLSDAFLKPSAKDERKNAEKQRKSRSGTGTQKHVPERREHCVKRGSSCANSKLMNLHMVGFDQHM